jgi:GT2 family glycosyltransferase
VKIDVSIIIVTYNGKEVTLKGLESYRKAISQDKSHSYQVIVVDNDSKDGVADAVEKEFPEVLLIRNPGNHGFAKANNIGYEKAEGRYILFSNPDIENFENTIPDLVKYMDSNPDVGACTPFLELVKTGKLDWPSHRGFPTPWASFCYYAGLQKLFAFSKTLSKLFGKYHLLEKDMSQPHEVDAITGAFFFVRREVFEKAGKWDERYFMYAEDLDLSFQIKKLGYKIIFNPNVKALHYHGLVSGLKAETGAITKADPATKERAYNAFYDTMKIFYDKNLKEKYPRFIRALVFWGIDYKKAKGSKAKKV